MFIYYLLIFSLIFFFFFLKNKFRISNIYNIYCILFIVLAFARDPFIGKDNLAYFDYFNHLLIGIRLGQFELFFSLYLDIFIYFSDNFQFFLILTSFLTLAPLFIIVNKFINLDFNRVLFLLLFLCTTYIFTFSILRNYIALSLIILALSFIVDRPLLSFIFTIFGSLFHISLLFLGFLFFISKYMKLSYYLLVFLLLPLIFVVFDSNSFQSLLIYLIDVLRPGYNLYEVIEIDANPSLTIIFMFLLYDIFLLLNTNIRGKYNNILLKNSLLFTFLSLFFFWIPNYYRLALLAIFIIGLFIIISIDSMKLKYSLSFQLVFMVFLLVFFYLNFQIEANYYETFF